MALGEVHNGQMLHVTVGGSSAPVTEISRENKENVVLFLENKHATDLDKIANVL